ncbi:hypothetical protein I8J38_00475, partial [Bacillus sp. OA1]|nr:hypothetical protein [Bacillus sp. OA1]
MHESIQEEIEKVSLLLEGGTTMHRAFREFNETFNFRELVFFHGNVQKLQLFPYPQIVLSVKKK